MDRKNILKNLKAIALSLIGFGLTACEIGNSNTFVPDTPSGPSMLQLIVNGEQYDVGLPATEHVNLRTLTTEFPADIQVLNASQFQQITIGG